MPTNLKEKLNQKLTVINMPAPQINEDGEVLQLPCILPEIQVPFDEVKQRIAMLQQFVREYMVEGVDYGLIPNCKRPSLLKSGAEKLAEIYGLSKQIDVINRTEDYQQGFFLYEVKATLINKRTGYVEAEGIGNCNSREKKYVDQNPYSIANTLLKMAKKRALVDAVLSATRSSGIFTQDIEDLNAETLGRDKPDMDTKPPQADTTTNPRAMASQKQVKFIHNIVAQKGYTIEQLQKLLQESYRIDSPNQLSKPQASELIDHLQRL